MKGTLLSMLPVICDEPTIVPPLDSRGSSDCCGIIPRAEWIVPATTIRGHEMVILKIDFAQNTIAVASGGDILHCCRTLRSKVATTIIDKRVIHSGSLKTWKWRRTFASNTIPAVFVWIR